MIFGNLINPGELTAIILVAEAAANTSGSVEEIADYLGSTHSEANYYISGAEILGLVVVSEVRISTSDIGTEIIELDKENREKKIRSILQNNVSIQAILSTIENSSTSVDFSQLTNTLQDNILYNPTVSEGELKTLVGWLLEASLIEVDLEEANQHANQTYYRINEHLDESDFIEPHAFEESIYPARYSEEELDIKENHMQVISFLRKREQGKIVVPEFQRNQIWKQQQKSRFIESLILNIPVPPFYISQDLNGNMIIIDGLQRSTAIFEFLENKYKLVGLEALPQLNGFYYSNLTLDLAARIEDRELLLYILKPTVPMSIVYDIFNRINANGTQLTRQEIRNCIYIGKSTRLLAQLADDHFFKLATGEGFSPQRMKDREAILRFIAFSETNSIDSYRGDMDDFLARTMRKLNRYSNDEIDLIRVNFIRIMSLSYDFFGEDNFRVPSGNSRRGRLNIALFEVVAVFLYQTDESILITQREQIVARYHDTLLTDSEFRDAIRSSTNSEKKVKTRFEKTFSILLQ